ncbi:MAG TPA: DNA methyltransferase [Candidatus Omnitrophota bacterium]|nr:DNA methyltransferase [Candidatus Omnitrophota bacterium]
MKYLFILGRNIELSIAEIKSFLKRKNLEFKPIELINNGFLADMDKILPRDSVQQLGGTVSVGEVIASGNAKTIAKELDKINLYSGSENKLNYVLHDFNSDVFDEISLYLKKRFRHEGLKATEKKPTGTIKLQGGKFVPNIVSKNIDIQYFLFENNFGKITETSDYEKIEERDMKKPVRRNELSISPRLAKILINLTEIKNNGTLLDPFCGIGTIMQEALLQNINAIGIDKDKKAIDDAKINLKWFGFDEKNYKLVNDDSFKINIRKTDAIATEPELAELQKSAPNITKAKEINSKFEELMINVLNNLKKNVSGRIVFTAPLIFAGREKIPCNLNHIASRTGLKIIGQFPEFRENSIVGRSIMVLEK